MKIDNKRNTYRLWLSRMVTTIIFTVAILVIIFIPWFDNSETLLSKYHLVILIAIVYILLNLNNYLKRPYFVSYNDQGEMIVLRYYPLSLFTSQKHSIEIPKKQLLKFELQTFYFGSQQMIVLYQHFRNKVAKYPPISLSAVDKQDRERIIQSLNKYITS